MTTSQLAQRLADFPAWLTEVHAVYAAAARGDADSTRLKVREALVNPNLAKTPVGSWMRDWQRADYQSRKAA